MIIYNANKTGNSIELPQGVWQRILLPGQSGDAQPVGNKTTVSPYSCTILRQVQ